MKKKELIIISGVTGTIGSEFWKTLILKKNTLVIGISRKGIPIPVEGIFEFPAIYKVDMSQKDEITQFIDSIEFDKFAKVVYVHGVGEFKTELEKDGTRMVKNDRDNDGVDDSIKKLVFDAWNDLYLAIRKKSSNIPISTILFGSLTDKYEYSCFYSFAKSHNLLKERIQSLIAVDRRLSAICAQISTVLSPAEMIARPYVGSIFSDFKFWLPPHELVEKILKLLESKGFVEADIYRPWPKFPTSYFEEKETIERRMKEIYNIDFEMSYEERS